MLDQLVIRPVTKEDISGLEKLAFSAQYGLSSLPKDRVSLSKKINASVTSFAKKVKAKEETYIFVLEDRLKKEIVGTCSIISKVGVSQPFYAYKIEKQSKKSFFLKKETQTHILRLQKIENGPTEIGGLYLMPEYRMKGIGRFLSLCRFLFMSLDLNRFEKTVVAEMRGVSNENGQSPFWEHVGRHFFQVTFEEADLLKSSNHDFIGELLPDIPLIIELLPQNAQDVIGRAHAYTLPALRLLQKEGFTLTDHIDVFDGGPKVSSILKNIRTVKETKNAVISDIVDKLKSEKLFILGAGDRKKFQMGCGEIRRVDGNKVKISKQLANTMDLQIGERITYAPLYPAVQMAANLDTISTLISNENDAVKQSVSVLSSRLKQGDHTFLRRFSDWYKTVAILSKTNG
jgi:arginine N-succinyltransferase